MGRTFFISAIDTDVGKSYATGYLAKMMMSRGQKVITQKLIQTGNKGISEDIQLHRKIMNLPMQEVDLEGLTCPYIFSYPCSPHLAAQLDGLKIEIRKIQEATSQLERLYDIVLLEGAGGLMVPISETYLTIDYIQDNRLPLIFVTSSKLGSINHTLLSLELCKQRKVSLAMLVYNHFPTVDQIIAEDTASFLKEHLKNQFPTAEWIDLPFIKNSVGEEPS